MGVKISQSRSFSASASLSPFFYVLVGFFKHVGAESFHVSLLGGSLFMLNWGELEAAKTEVNKNPR